MEYPKCLQNELDSIEKRKQQALRYHKATLLVEQCIKHFKKEGMRASVGTGIGSLNGALLHVDVDSIKEITPILKWLGTHGWHQADKEPNDYAELQRRTWRLKNDQDKDSQIQLSAFFNGDSCKFIQIGTEIRPKYELRCQSEMQ